MHRCYFTHYCLERLLILIINLTINIQFTYRPFSFCIYFLNSLNCYFYALFFPTLEKMQNLNGSMYFSHIFLLFLTCLKLGITSQLFIPSFFNLCFIPAVSTQLTLKEFKYCLYLGYCFTYLSKFPPITS